MLIKKERPLVNILDDHSKTVNQRPKIKQAKGILAKYKNAAFIEKEPAI